MPCDQSLLSHEACRGSIPKTVHGPVRTIKWAILIACLTLYYVLPWVRWYRGPGAADPGRAAGYVDASGSTSSTWNSGHRISGCSPGLLIMGAVALFLVTSVVGRVWCGYTCPQTVWTDLFMWVERAIEGDRAERMARDAAPLTADTIWKKLLKHWIWIGIAFWTGGAWIMYFTDAPTMIVDFWTLPGVHHGLFLYRTVHRDHLSAGRLGARAGLHLHVPVAALPVGDARRPELHRHLSGVARRAADARQAPRAWRARPATASIAACVSRPAPPASTSATASSWSASTAGCAWMPATP